MKLFTPSIVVLLLAAVISAQSPTAVVPIVGFNVGGVLGGVRNGKWVKTETFVKTMNAADYNLVAWANGDTAHSVKGTKPEVGDPCEDFYNVDLDPKLDTGIALGSAAQWNPVPRVPKAMSTDNEYYRAVVGSIVRAHGIAKPKIEIRQLYQVDLDGDGQDEVVLAATYGTSENPQPSGIAGEYSFLLLRKIIRGTPKNIFIAGEFHPRGHKFGANSVYKIDTIADLNGDGKMEIVMDSAYYEGSGTVVYEIKGGIVKEVLDAGCGV